MGLDPGFSIASVFAPSPNRLLDLLRAQVDDELLWDIADADYGANKEENFRALKLIRDTGIVPAPIEWVPAEVLGLTRYSSPGRYGEADPASLYREHLQRAFACAILVRASADWESLNQVYKDDRCNVVQLLGSTLVLGREYLEALGSLLAWKFTDGPYKWEYDIEDRPYVALALLIVGVAGRPEEQIAQLAAWTLAEEADVRAQWGDPPLGYGEGWRIGDQFEEGWLLLADYLREQSAAIESAELRETLETLAARFVSQDRPAE